MQKSEYENMFVNEGSHFYYRLIHESVINLVEKYKPEGSLTILDAGAGTGHLSKNLKRYGNVTSIDLSNEAIRLARKNGVLVKKASVTKIPFGAEKFDLAVSIDVLSHLWVNNSSLALKEIYRVLKPGGICVVRVPANKNLKLAHDYVVYTKKRFSKEEFRTLLKKSGFRILRLSFSGFLPGLLSFAKMRLEKNSHKKYSAVFKLPKIINDFLSLIIIPEAYLLKFIDIPSGISLISVVQKPLLSPKRPK